jgi:hypothetical protein
VACELLVDRRHLVQCVPPLVVGEDQHDVRRIALLLAGQQLGRRLGDGLFVYG